ncbi:unnamed protein product, partial [Meganyctiphanes norvegica]
HTGGGTQHPGEGMMNSLLVLVFVTQGILQVVSQDRELFSSTSCYNGHALCEVVDANRVPPPLSAQAQLMRPGRSVQRGPDWQYGDEDGGNGSVGDVLDWNTGSDELYWVYWPSSYNYRLYVMHGGHERDVGTYEFMFSEVEVRNLQDCWDTQENMCANGDTCGDIDGQNCAYTICAHGDHYDCVCADETDDDNGATTTTSTIVSYSQCCALDGLLYPPGRRYDDFCAQMQCVATPSRVDGFWIFTGQFDWNCRRCEAYWDPHVSTFDWNWYAFQGCGEYSMAQEGISYSPKFGIFSKFEEYCGHGISCVLDATMQQDDIKVTIESPPDDDQVFVKVNGFDYQMTPLPQFVNDDDKILAFHYPRRPNCEYFLGSKGMMVQFCGNTWTNSLTIWAMPDLQGQVNGLCGFHNNDETDDYLTRQGTTLELSEASVNEFASSWKTDASASTDCPSAGARSYADRKDSCNDFDIYEEQCKNTIASFGSQLRLDSIQHLIDACTYDLCQVEDPSGYLEGAVAETVKIQNDIEKVTVNLTSFDGCSEDMESMGGECLKRISDMTTDWESAKVLCEVEGLYLAEPWDITAVATYLLNNYDELYYWVGGRGDGEVARWLSGGEVSYTEPWMRRTYGQISGDSQRCLDIVTYGNWPARNETLAAGYCNGTQQRAILCSRTRRPEEY